LPVIEKRQWIKDGHKQLSVAAQCDLVGLARSSYYYRPIPCSPEDLLLMRLVDELYTARPHRGSRSITGILRREGRKVTRKRIQGIMRELGLAGQQPGPNTSKSHPEQIRFPYLLREFDIVSPMQVWSADITYIRLPDGFVYLTAVIDWFSRLVLAHRLSNSLESTFCTEAFEEAIGRHGRPEIFNTDQGVQFSSAEFVNAVLNRGIRFSMDGRGRALDNVFVERLWRSVKYEDVYLHDYQNVREARTSLGKYFQFYNTERLHQSLEYKTPYEVHYASKE
jgi:putative transposase